MGAALFVDISAGTEQGCHPLWSGSSDGARRREAGDALTEPWSCAPSGTRKGDRLGVNLPEPQTAAEAFTFLSSEKTRHEYPISSSLFYCGIFILYLHRCVSACEMMKDINPSSWDRRSNLLLRGIERGCVLVELIKSKGTMARV